MTDVGFAPLSRQTTTQQQPSTTPLPTTTSSLAPTNIASGPPTSLTDPGTSPRPRDARTIHILLASLGVTAYQERVPLQLLDFAYRYTSSVLSDAHHLTSEGYVAAAHPSNAAAANSKKNAATSGEGDITIAALRLATASRNAYQFSSGALPKEALLEVAGERNRVRLPDVDKDVFFGVRLPHERYVQTGTGWGLMEEWDSEEEVSTEEQNGEVNGVEGEVSAGGESKGVEDEDEDMEDQDEGFEQVFGGGEADGDGTMEE